MWGKFSLVLNRCKKKMKTTAYGPIKNLSPLLKGKKGTIGMEKKITWLLHIISPKLIYIPRPCNVISFHVSYL
jgi:hypothetical protein